jgi:endoglucanase
MTVSGIITVTATATDAVGVTRVDLYVDGVFSVSDTTAPYTFALDTTTLTNGAHSLVCKAYDAANNEGLSTPFSITVSNAAPNLQFTRQLRGSNVAGGETNWGSYTLGNGLYTTGVPFRGINRPGPEYGDSWPGTTYGDEAWTGQAFFEWPNATGGGGGTGSPSAWATELNYYASKGFNTIRLPISWERLQNTLNGALDTTYSANLVACVNQATAAGFTVLVDLHNYGRYAVGAFTSPGVVSATWTQRMLGDGFLTFAHLADVWTKIANLFLTNDHVQFDLMNEPHDLIMTSTTFFAGFNTVIAAIRATGSKHLVIVPNTRGSDITHWDTYSPGDIRLGAGNGGPLDSVAALAVTDSADNYAFSIHQYQDNPSSSTSYPNLFSTIVSWAATNNKRLYLGEFGSVSTAANGFIGVGGLLSYMNTNASRFVGWTEWNLSPYYVTNSTYTADSSTGSMGWYTPYLTPNTQSVLDGAVSGTNYLFMSNTDADYLASKQLNFVRLIISWEALQPRLYGAITTSTYATRMWALVDYLTNTKGMFVMLEPHGASDANFATYKGVKVGTSPVPKAALADFWSKIAGDVRMKNNPKTMIGLSNEPNFISGSNWWGAAQLSVDAIRDAGFKNLVMVPGFGYTNSATWTTAGSYGGDQDASPKSNAFYALSFTDKLATLDATNYPLGNFCFTTHQYFDTDGSGTTTGVVSSSIGVTRATTIIDWCNANSKRCHITEFGTAASTAGASTAVGNFLSYLNSNRTPCLGWSWWTYGPPTNWAGYQFTLCPTSSYTVDSPQYPLISGFLPAP